MKIYDAFTFFNELDLLEIRLKELYDVVDYFIICESTKTHQNNDKPLYFAQNKDRFLKYESKIIYLLFDPVGNKTSWELENGQRNYLQTWIPELDNGDLFILSDADEIMSRQSVENLRIDAKYQNEAYTSIMQMSYNFINLVVEEPWHHRGWRGSVVIPSDLYNSHCLQFFRDRKDSFKRYESSGWHLSFLGGIEKVYDKIISYAHTEYNNTYLLSQIENRVKNLSDPLGRREFKFKLESDLSKFPHSSLEYPHLFYAQ